MQNEPNQPTDVPRRSFLSKSLAALIGLAALAAPMVAGITVLLDPLRKRGSAKSDGNWIRVAALDQIPADGKPHLFPVVEQTPRDKWNEYEPQAVGAVFLTRTNLEATPTALSTTCPHLGCSVGFDAKHDRIVCPCHNGIFDCSGKQSEGSTVSPRDLDPLATRVDESTGDVQVDYKRFKGGIADREEV